MTENLDFDEEIMIQMNATNWAFNTLYLGIYFSRNHNDRKKANLIIGYIDICSELLADT